MKSRLLFLLSLILLVLGQVNVHAQDAGVTSSIDSTATTATVQDTVAAQPVVKKESFWSKLMFWKEKPKPKPAVEFNTQVEDIWHENIARFMGATDEEFYRFGYARKGVQWYPVFFLRRFEMIQNQYVHTLIIKGRPEKVPKVKGITMGLYGIEVTNEGFEFQMPTVASVSRSQKKFDDVQALDVATNRLQTFGFEEVRWLKDKKKETRDIANTWSISNNNAN